MISSLKPHNQIPSEELSALESRMVEWYKNPPNEYYILADQGKDFDNRDLFPYHVDLLQQINKGDHICEFGCGSGSFGKAAISKGAKFTGLDWSEDLLSKNRLTIPEGAFRNISSVIKEELFDVVYSQYVLEHTIHPEEHLEQLWSHCRPGGLISVICPDFINCDSLPNSVFFGKTPNRLSTKILTGRLFDALLHLLDWKMFSKRWNTKALLLPPKAFWINANPRILEDHIYTIDSDAVHLPRLEDVESWFLHRGASIIRSSRSVDAAPDIRRFNMYLLVQKAC